MKDTYFRFEKGKIKDVKILNDLSKMSLEDKKDYLLFLNKKMDHLQNVSVKIIDSLINLKNLEGGKKD